jgi:hypothetical protein
LVVLALAEDLLAAEHWTDAASNAEVAAGFAKTVYGESSCRVAPALVAWADAREGGGRLSDALPLAERALALSKSGQIDPLALARAEMAVAVALPDQDRARALATSARAGARDPKLAARIDAWLAAHPTP